MTLFWTFQRSSSCTASVSVNAADSGLSDEQLRESLLTAAEEVLRDKLTEEFAKTKAELESLHATSRNRFYKNIFCRWQMMPKGELRVRNFDPTLAIFVVYLYVAKYLKFAQICPWYVAKSGPKLNSRQALSSHYLRSVWPNVGLKSSPIVSELTLKIATAVFTWKSSKSYQTIGTFVRKIVSLTFQK